MGRHRNDVVRAAIGVRMLLRKDALRLHSVAPVPRERRRRFLDVDAVDLDIAIGGIQELNENEKRGWGSEQLRLEAELFTSRRGDKCRERNLAGHLETHPVHAAILTHRAMMSWCLEPMEDTFAGIRSGELKSRGGLPGGHH